MVTRTAPQLCKTCQLGHGRYLLDTLENYIASDYLAEKQEIEAIDRTLINVATTFSEIFSKGRWPYEFFTNESEVPLCDMSPRST